MDFSQGVIWGHPDQRKDTLSKRPKPEEMKLGGKNNPNESGLRRK